MLNMIWGMMRFQMGAQNSIIKAYLAVNRFSVKLINQMQLQCRDLSQIAATEKKGAKQV